MAGRGSRYANEGYSTPKPLIEIAGKPMLYHAFQSVKNVPYTKLIFIALKEHEIQYDVSNIIKKHISQSFELIFIDEVTEGQLCTVLKATSFFNENESILIAASDSYIESSIGQEITQSDADGIISVIDLPGEQWSFAKTDVNGNVTEVAEKKRISNLASTGLYYFKNSKVFEREANAIVNNKETTKGEYYVIPLYAKLIAKGARISISRAKAMWDMGTPEAKLKFETHLNEENQNRYSR
jgi:NDP-sugar pyrophosphorylase family protein